MARFRGVDPGGVPPERAGSSTCAIMAAMATVGLRELRQQASQLVRRVQAGERVTITVSGRPAARLVPAEPHIWREFRDVAELFAGPPDLEWTADRDRLNTVVRDPWPAE
jgi:prevent-host-death family protein